jgi:tRNA (guanine-N7-)-methyltransferase
MSSQKPTSDDKKSKDAGGVRHPPIRSYGRRWSKGLRGAREMALDEVLPQILIEDRDAGLVPACKDPASLANDAAQNPVDATIYPAWQEYFDPHTFFDKKPKQVWFEIGFGNGEHILHQAINHPDAGLIGCEPFMNGVAALCVGIGEKKVKNIRLWPDDARLLMGRLKPGSIDRLFLLHPDPWPKKRHHKRRFVQTETLDEIARLLKPGAEFRMATDHPELASWLLEKAYFHPAFEWTANAAEDWNTPPADWPETRYGQKGLKQGRPPVYLIFRRKAN